MRTYGTRERVLVTGGAGFLVERRDEVVYIGSLTGVNLAQNATIPTTGAMNMPGRTKRLRCRTGAEAENGGAHGEKAFRAQHARRELIRPNHTQCSSRRWT